MNRRSSYGAAGAAGAKVSPEVQASELEDGRRGSFSDYSWYQARAEHQWKRLRVLFAWGFVQAAILSLFHLPFRLAFAESELDPVWIIVGIALDLPRLTRLQCLSCRGMYNTCVGMFQLLPWNSGIFILLLTKVIAKPADAWPYRIGQFITWIPLQEVVTSLVAWDQELNTTRKHRFRLTLCLLVGNDHVLLIGFFN
jgi:hypothetical protein